MEKTSIRSLIVTALVALFFGFGGAAIWTASGLGNGQTREYLLENPDILPQMAENFQKQQASERLSGVAEDVNAPFPGAILGNPNGSITLVEFTDYGCSFCRMSEPQIRELIAANPDLKVVIREWPIFEGSDQAARMALAAAKQGKFSEFHTAMFATGGPSTENILSAATTAGIDMAKAQEVIYSPEAEGELAKNTSLAQQLGFGGTPSWVVGDQAFEGAIGQEGLQKAIDTARGS